MIRTIVYTSRAILSGSANTNVKPNWLDALVEDSAINNKAFNISGILSYNDGKILQVIEGESIQIQNLFTKIRNDERHQKVFTLLDIKDSQRVFSDWGMAIEENVKSSSLFKKFLVTHILDLVEMTENQSDELLHFFNHVFNHPLSTQDQGKIDLVHQSLMRGRIS